MKNHIAANHRENSKAFRCKKQLCDFHTGNKMELKSHEKSHTGYFLNWQLIIYNVLPCTKHVCSSLIRLRCVESELYGKAKKWCHNHFQNDFRLC